jgi:hypothetical protein
MELELYDDGNEEHMPFYKSLQWPGLDRSWPSTLVRDMLALLLNPHPGEHHDDDIQRHRMCANNIIFHLAPVLAE